MIHYYCDGSYKERMITCGIVRVGERITQYFRYTVQPTWIQRHELFAIYHTLFFIEKHKDKQVTISNDCLCAVDCMNDKFKNKKWKNQLEIVKNKLAQLREKGYQITIQRKSEKESPYIKQAHKCSRLYLYNPKIQEQILKQKELQLRKEKELALQRQKEQKLLEEQNKKKQLELKKKEEREKELTKKRLEEKKKVAKLKQRKKEKVIVEPPLTEKAKKRKTLRDIVEQKGNTETVNTNVLQKSKAVHFRKVTIKKWGAFNERNEPIYVHKNMAEITYYVLQEVFQHRETIEVNKGYEQMFISYLQSQSIQTEHEKMAHAVKKWMEEKRIQFVS